MTLIAHDTFVEASTIDLSSHTADVGGGWTASGGTIQVIAGAEVAEDQNSANGNRYNLTTSVGSGPIDVSIGLAVPSINANVFPGIGVRRSTASAANGYEFQYDFLNNQWKLSDGGVSTTATFPEAWDGTLRTFKVHAENGLVIGYVNGVEKCRLTSNVNPGSTFAGFLLGNFSGTAFRMQASNFEVDSVASLLSIQSGRPVSISRRVSMRPGPGGLAKGPVWAQSTSAPAAILPPAPPVVTINSPFRLQMAIPMRPSAGGFVGGNPFEGATSAPAAITPPNPPGGTGVIQMQTLQRIGNA